MPVYYTILFFYIYYFIPLQPESKIMSKKIADIDFNNAEFINDSLVDFYESTETAVDPLDDSTDIDDSDVQSVETNTISNSILDSDYDSDDDQEDQDDTLDKTTENETEPVAIDDDSSYNDYNNLALIALSLKEEDPEFISFDIDKDLKPDVFISSLKSELEKVKENARKEEEAKYGDAARYLNLIVEGGKEEAEEAIEYHKIAAIELTGSETEEQLEGVVKAWLYRKGTPEADIDDLVSIYKDKGVLQDRAQDSIEFHKEQEEIVFNNWKINRDAQIAEYQKKQFEYQKAVKAQIEKGNVKGLAIRDKKRLEDAIFKPTEIVETIDNSGRKVLQKVPLISLKMQELNNDLEQQLALQLLILDNFDFSSLVDTAKRKVNNNLINVLNDRVTANTKKSSSSRYFED